ncbi:unnamed protein product [Onchocerca ochengi]|uniref:F-box domain-containing protein n=1 Tax=Onchocerca ochengi TaxID=42157 RepID=A0A182E3Q5_ONCOC|nr:unnamed protein product [Onchocerca ochengi]
MAALYDMTRRLTKHQIDNFTKKLEEDELPTVSLGTAVTVEKLPDKMLLAIFSYLSPYQVLIVGQVCKRWKEIAQNPSLWHLVSLRPSYGGLQVTNQDYFLYLIGMRFTELRVIELATDLITPNVLHELAARCPQLWSMTLGTYEKIEDEEEEVYETVNVHKLKQYIPNLRVVNFWGVPFITDEHVESISSNCAHLECLCINYCTKVTGSCLRLVLQRCKKLRSLLLAHATLDNEIMKSVEWEKTYIEELNICGTELSSDALISILTRLKYLIWLDASWLENMNDQVLEAWLSSDSIVNLHYLNLDTCDSLNEASLTDLISRMGNQLLGLNLGGHHKLLEYFWTNMIPKLKNIKVLVMGTAEDCCSKVLAKIHIDQFIDSIAQNCPKLCRLEIRWDDGTLRFSDKSSKFIDTLRLKCLKLRSVVLSDGQYYELVRANFERADRLCVVRTLEMCRTGLMHCSKYYNQLLFN